MNQICLVPCVSKKRSHPTRAEELYVSTFFKKARNYALKFDRWYILSARYGLVEPARTIEPYEMTLNRMTKRSRHDWAGSVVESICQWTNGSERIVILAGAAYRENLVPMLRKRGYLIEVPMEGMRIGQQLQWLGEHSFHSGGDGAN